MIRVFLRFDPLPSLSIQVKVKCEGCCQEKVFNAEPGQLLVFVFSDTCCSQYSYPSPSSVRLNCFLSSISSHQSPNQSAAISKQGRKPTNSDHQNKLLRWLSWPLPQRTLTAHTQLQHNPHIIAHTTMKAATKAMASLPFGELDRLVKAIGECKSKSEEDRIISAEVDVLKQRLSDPRLDKSRGREYMVGWRCAVARVPTTATQQTHLCCSSSRACTQHNTPEHHACLAWTSQVKDYCVCVAQPAPLQTPTNHSLLPRAARCPRLSYHSLCLSAPGAHHVLRDAGA